MSQSSVRQAMLLHRSVATHSAVWIAESKTTWVMR
jgi:hypothetical protein